MNTPIITIINPRGSIPCTIEQLYALGVTDSDIAAGEKRFTIESFGPWNIISSITGIVEEATYTANGAEQNKKSFYPARKCSNPKSMGYDMEGTISLNGKRRNVFTSSQLFELPDGKLIDVATLHTCTR
jgi:hypothetical protein